MIVNIEGRSVSQMCAVGAERIIAEFALVANLFYHVARCQVEDLKPAEHIPVVDQVFVGAAKSQVLAVGAEFEIPDVGAFKQLAFFVDFKVFIEAEEKEAVVFQVFFIEDKAVAAFLELLLPFGFGFLRKVSQAIAVGFPLVFAYAVFFIGQLHPVAAAGGHGINLCFALLGFMGK